MAFVLLACEILSSTVETCLFVSLFSFYPYIKAFVPSCYDVLFIPIQQGTYVYTGIYSIYLITLKFLYFIFVMK